MKGAPRLGGKRGKLILDHFERTIAEWNRHFVVTPMATVEPVTAMKIQATHGRRTQYGFKERESAS